VATKDAVVGESVSFDRIGKVDMIQKPSRHAPTPNADPNHERRWAQMSTLQSNIFLDPDDLKTVLTDPTSDYVRVESAAIGRAWDQIVLNAALGTAITGRVGEPGATIANATGSETWPITDRKGVVHQIAETGNVGLTFLKVRQAKQILDALMTEKDRVFFFDSYGLYQLLGTLEVGSYDFNTVKAISQGEMDNVWMGFKWVMVDSDLMNTFVNTGSFNCVSGIAMVRGAMGLGVSEEKIIRISERPDLSYANQVYCEMMGGSVRRDGERIVEVQYFQG
jgi:hypothetical protein